MSQEDSKAPLNDSRININVATDRATRSKPDPGRKKVPLKICKCSESGRNLVVCIDGTSNQFGINNTNVIELYSLLKKNPEDKQKTWYNSGIGTYAKPSWKSWAYWKRVCDNKIDLAIAWNFESILMDAYRWLSDIYEPGDRIFLFGFSRGAYQVRALSGMIHKVGLIHRGNEKQIPFAFQLYADPKSGGMEDLDLEKSKDADNPQSSVRSSPSDVSDSEDDESRPKTSRRKTSKTPAAEHFKATFSRKDVRVHFVGVWDTVSSIGVVRSASLPYTTKGMEHVCFFRHALALDERRVKFLPEYAWGGGSLKPPPSESTIREVEQSTKEESPTREWSKASARREEEEISRENVHTKEVWFAGSHSDIGGGNIENAKLNRSRPPLRWMCFEADAVGLRIQPIRRNMKKDKHVESLKGLFWNLMECMPIGRLTYKSAESTTHWPHLGRGRMIVEGQKVHASLLREYSYIPKAVPPRKFAKDWRTFKEALLVSGNELVESEMYDSLGQQLKEYLKLGAGYGMRRREIQAMALSAEGIWGLRQRIMALRDSEKDEDLALIRSSLVICSDVASGPLQNTNADAIDEIRELIIEHNVFWLLVEHPSVDARTLRAMVQLFGGDDYEITHRSRSETKIAIEQPLTIDDRKATNSFLGRFTIPLSTSFDGRADEAEFLPDGKYLISASDETIRIWDTQSGHQMGNSMQGDYACISHNGKYIASYIYTADEVLIWNAETGVFMRKFDTPGDVWTVDFLGPNDNIVMCGLDSQQTQYVYFYNLQTNTGFAGPILGVVPQDANCAASPAEPVFAFGREDTINVFKMRVPLVDGRSASTESETDSFLESNLEEIFTRGLSELVDDSIFSPDGRYLATVSYTAGRLQLFDLINREHVGEPFGSDDIWPDSVTFFWGINQRLCIIYASHDNTVRVWDAMTGRSIGVLGGFVFHGWVMFSKDGRCAASRWSRDKFKVWAVDLELLDFDIQGSRSPL